MDHKSQCINNFHQYRHSSPTSEDCSIFPQIPQECPLAMESAFFRFSSSTRERRSRQRGVQHRMLMLGKLWFLYLSHKNHLTGLAQNNYFQILLGSTSWLEPISGQGPGTPPVEIPSCLKPPPGIPVSPHHLLSKQHPLQGIVPIYLTFLSTRKRKL